MVTEVKSVFGCAENYEVHERHACDFFILYYYSYSLLYENFPAQIYQLHMKWVHKDVVLNLEYNHEVESTRNSKRHTIRKTFLTS